eukprot:EG_transcript_49475
MTCVVPPQQCNNENTVSHHVATHYCTNSTSAPSGKMGSIDSAQGACGHSSAHALEQSPQHNSKQGIYERLCRGPGGRVECFHSAVQHSGTQRRGTGGPGAGGTAPAP